MMLALLISGLLWAGMPLAGLLLNDSNCPVRTQRSWIVSLFVSLANDTETAVINTRAIM